MDQLLLKTRPIYYSIILCCCFLLLCNSTAFAQTGATATGIVKDATGVLLPGVSVRIENKATNFRAGTSTNAQGMFSIGGIPAGKDYIITFTSVGYKSKVIDGYTISLTDKLSIAVVLDEDAAALGEVVVTALGIKRNKKALGYTIAELKGNELTQGAEANVANALSGKVSGVQVSRASSGAGGSSKVIIRGNNSLIGNSQPLYVVDGVPIDNQNVGAASSTGGTDYGDGISNINPDDIQSISVLKGPNAAALYGQRGSNGVILITTKSGTSGKGMNIQFNSDFSLGNALVAPDFQNEYAQGLNGNFTHLRRTDGSIITMAQAIAGGITGTPKMSAGRDRLTRSSWGPKMEGQSYEDQWGNLLTLTPQPDTYSAFFQTEKQYVNNISVEGGNEKVNYRLSYANTYIDGYVPTNVINRNNFNLRTQAKITDKFNLDAKLNYIMQDGTNRPTLSDASDNPAYLLISQPRSIPMDIMSQYKWTANDVAKQLGYTNVFAGLEKTYATNSSTANPYWTINETRNTDRRDRVIGLLRLSYDFMPWLKLTATGGTDFYTDQRLRYRAVNTYQSLNRKGDMSETVIRVREDNYDALLNSNFKLENGLGFTLNVGASHLSRYLRQTGNSGSQFVVPNLYVINNTLTNSYIFGLTESEINSVYSSGQVSYKDYLYLDLSARNDWSSTLSKENNSFFYPSVSASFIASEALNFKSNVIRYLKLRGSWAQAGSSGNPYQLTGTYSLDQFTHGGVPLGSFTSIIPDKNLTNELTTSIEFGSDLELWSGRVGLGFTVYQASTKDQILDVPISPSSLFTVMRINAGEIRNRGIEVSLNATPIKTASGFTWKTTFNFNKNENKVLSLHPGVETFLLGSDRGINVVAEVGKPFGQLIGTQFAWLKDENGNRLIDPNTGLPLTTTSRVQETIGNAQPDWLGGFFNSFTYKGITLNALIDIRQGGMIFSQSNREEIIYGTSNKTVAGRDGSYLAKGVVAQKNPDGSWSGTGVANTKTVKAQDYWNVVASDKEVMVSEEMLNDGSYIAMRELSMRYQIPVKYLPTSKIRNATVGVYGRNLFYFQRKTDGFSPESASFNTSNSSIGIESTSLPMLRNIGFNLSIGF
ncbi:SusC/RagA family TonB-linked outer membrane protein [Pedobacter nyackensis]|uniref:TonB-linked outer membrane protein, SusC/RagA family n=1 Tax=Pedobacter nyackensis TaxID=475255 RepID=A0A1W2AAV7_9SPHI|nr:SusC/RagA family TonB-linked outer membrane protein [Pedobacter nyackensis]SMC57723.1 TonB-linked outer membrane protein, SusC/RagA family [Pedobacter nyackensis]